MGPSSASLPSWILPSRLGEASSSQGSFSPEASHSMRDRHGKRRAAMKQPFGFHGALHRFVGPAFDTHFPAAALAVAAKRPARSPSTARRKFVRMSDASSRGIGSRGWQWKSFGGVIPAGRLEGPGKRHAQRWTLGASPFRSRWRGRDGDFVSQRQCLGEACPDRSI